MLTSLLLTALLLTPLAAAHNPKPPRGEPTPIPACSPTIPLTNLTTLTTISNHIIGPTHTVPISVFSSACQTVTAAGEPVFTIQTDTHLPSGCTVTVYSGSSSSTKGNSTMTVTSASVSTSATVATQTTNAARRGAVGSGLGLAAVLGAVVVFL